MPTLLTSDHPECSLDQVFLGNFTPNSAAEIGWKSVTAGNEALCADGSPYPNSEFYDVRPYFALRAELEQAGIPLP